MKSQKPKTHQTSIIRSQITHMSLYKQIVIEDPSQFDSIVSQYENNDQYKAVLVYVTGSLDSTSGKSWCPDCVVSEPIIKYMFEQIEEDLENDGVGVPETPQIAFIKCPVVREPYKKPDFVYRTHSKLQIRSIPTLILWSADTNYRMRIIEGQFRDSSAVLNFGKKIFTMLTN